MKQSGKLLHLVRLLTKGVVNGSRLAVRLHRLLEGETEEEKLRRLLEEASGVGKEGPEQEEAAVAATGEYDHLPSVQANPKLRAVLAKPMHQVRAQSWLFPRRLRGV